MTAAPGFEVRPAIEQLWTASEQPPGEARSISAELALAYGGDLRIGLRADRPTIVVNFVSTLDGVVSFATADATGGGEVSGFFAPDRFVMGLLRALADVVLIGAGTLRDAATEPWTANSIYPEAAPAFVALRRLLGLPAQPTTVIVTASGRLDLSHSGLAHADVPLRIVTTEQGASVLAAQPLPAHAEVQALHGSRVAPHELVAALGEGGARLVLCEGGPHLLGELLAADYADELFLTVAPQLAGRTNDRPRLSLVEGVGFDPGRTPWCQLESLRRSASHLFLRYRFDHGLRPA